MTKKPASPAFTTPEAQALLAGKKIAVLGDSIQRTAYKDLVLLLQENRFMTKAENRARAHRSIVNDKLLAGGEMGQLTNDPNYTEVREYVKGDFSIRFYFITRASYPYVTTEVIPALATYAPDAVFICSMLWDIMRYGETFLAGEYRVRLDRLFSQVIKAVPDTCIIAFLNSPPVSDNCYGGVFVKQVLNKKPYLKKWHIEACEIAKSVVSQHGLDVIDFLEYLLPYQDQLVKDGLHWSSGVHRAITNRLLTHLAYCWAKEPATKRRVAGLDGLRTIYDDPEDAFLEDVRYLYDENGPPSSPFPYPSPHSGSHFSHGPPPPYYDSPFSNDAYYYDEEYAPPQPYINSHYSPRPLPPRHWGLPNRSNLYTTIRPPLRPPPRIRFRPLPPPQRMPHFEYQDVEYSQPLNRKRKAISHHRGAPPGKMLRPAGFHDPYEHSRASGFQKSFEERYGGPVGRSNFW